MPYKHTVTLTGPNGTPKHSDTEPNAETWCGSTGAADAVVGTAVATAPAAATARRPVMIRFFMWAPIVVDAHDVEMLVRLIVNPRATGKFTITSEVIASGPDTRHPRGHD